MKPANISINRLAIELRVPATLVSAIVNETHDITGYTALRLGRYFSTTSEFRMNLQTRYDLDVAADASRQEIERSIQPRNAA
jgi:addiction module HigA family antidote